MTLSLSLPPALPTTSPILASSLGVGSSLGAGNWLARIRSCIARQPFFFQSLPCPPDSAQRLDHAPAGPVVLKSVHGHGCESSLRACHGADRGGLRHG